jgi:cell shape-determining protein MreC
MKEYSRTTKGNFRHTITKSLRRKSLAILILIIIGLIFPWLYSKIASFVLYPLHVVHNWIDTGEGAVPYHLRSRANLVEEIKSLKQQLVSESGTQLSIKRLLEENQQLRLALNDNQTERPIVSRVLSRPGFLRYDLLQIDKGVEEGVKVGAPVFFNYDSVLGVVVHVEQNHSFVDLFTSPGFSSTAFIIGPNIYAVLEGQGGGSARLRLPQGVSLNEGQLVILPTVNSGVYGEIVKVEDDPKQPEQYGYIVPTVALNSLQYVMVGREVITERSGEVIDKNAQEALRKYFYVASSSLYQVADPYASSTNTTGF